MKKDFLLFDLDGTIIDSQDGILEAIQYTLKQFGIVEKRENLYCYIGPPILDALIQYHHFSFEDAQQAVPIYRHYYAKHGMVGNDLFPGVLQMLQSFAARKKIMAIATSKPLETATPILENLGIMPYFVFVGASTLSGERPHKVDVIRYTLQKLNVPSPFQAVMIGDRCYDIAGAQLAGIESIGVLYGYGSREELQTTGADQIVGTAMDLVHLIK